MSTTSTDTYDQIGIREDLANDIWDVSPTEVPFISNAPKTSASQTYHEWQTDSLASVSATTAIEGAAASFAVAAATSRIGNYTEILTLTVEISGTLEATDRAGRDREMAYQEIKRGKEIKRNMENNVCGINNAQAVGADDTRRESASYTTACTTNTSNGAGAGADPTTAMTTAATDGTQRIFTETILGTVIDSIFNAGGDPNIIMAGSFNKRAITGFSGNSDEVKSDNSDKTVINAVSLYISDYSTLKVVPNRFVRSRDVLVYEQSMWAIAQLRPMQSFDIAKVGDAERKQVLVEYTLMPRNEASSGIIRDCTTS
jgi:hypothetical protein